ncbi:hypothetical protein G6F59_017503 [Rhizopus arrhizus]|nr:hypothetical protein G6F59_017503 [Rhizopus arrhizus]
MTWRGGAPAASFNRIASSGLKRAWNTAAAVLSLRTWLPLTSSGNVRKGQVAGVGQAHEIAGQVQRLPGVEVFQAHAVGLGQRTGAHFGGGVVRRVGRVAGACAARFGQAAEAG